MTRHSRNTSSFSLKGLPDSVVKALGAELGERVAVKDQLGDLGRDLRRKSQDLMRRMHTGESASGGLKELKQMAITLTRQSRSAGMQGEESVEVPLQEWVEANVLWAIIENTPIPSPQDLGVWAAPYIMGLADAIGEVRRLSVTALGRGEPERAKALLAIMDALYSFLMCFEAPRSVIALKPKQDTARSLIERTRGEVESALFLYGLVHARGKRSRARRA